MFKQALAVASKLPAEQRDALLSRLDEVRRVSHNIEYGVDDQMDNLLAEHGVEGD